MNAWNDDSDDDENVRRGIYIWENQNIQHALLNLIDVRFLQAFIQRMIILVNENNKLQIGNIKINALMMEWRNWCQKTSQTNNLMENSETRMLSNMQKNEWLVVWLEQGSH